MTDVVQEVQIQSVLDVHDFSTNTESQTQTLVVDSGDTITSTTETNTLLVEEVVAVIETSSTDVQVLEVAVQGPPGVGSGSLEHITHCDPSRPIAYVGYANRIRKLDYATFPPTTYVHLTSATNTDWPNRATLSYTAEA